MLVAGIDFQNLKRQPMARLSQEHEEIIKNMIMRYYLAPACKWQKTTMIAIQEECGRLGFRIVSETAIRRRIRAHQPKTRSL
jgi:hypothetical protein